MFYYWDLQNCNKTAMKLQQSKFVVVGQFYFIAEVHMSAMKLQ